MWLNNAPLPPPKPTVDTSSGLSHTFLLSLDLGFQHISEVRHWLARWDLFIASILDFGDPTELLRP